MLTQMYDIFQNMTKSLEAMYILEGIKPVARMSFFENTVSRVEDFCKDNNLSIEISDYKVLLGFNESYSTKGKKIPIDSPIKGYLFVYLSKSAEKAARAKELEEHGDYFEFGRMLGYPECCARFFVKNREEELKKRNDYVMPAIHNSFTNVFPFHTNIFGRYIDISLLSHCPCSFDCRHSATLGKRFLVALRKNDREVAAQFEDLLKSVVIYSDDGIFLLNNYRIQKNVVEFSDVISTKQNPLFELLQKNRKLKILGRNKFAVANRRFSYPILVFE